ncbi:MAG TPA: hypothetical protein PKN64_12410, partial [Casimicrobium sp.]|nr:hypothetical protein [Casimicrobium sp.]
MRSCSIATFARRPLSAILAALPMLAAATEVPTADLKGLTDPPGVKRYAGAVLVYRDDVAYDELKFP